MDSEQYFSHNYKARSNRKIVKILMKHGLEGVGAYWCIVEMLYEENGFLPLSDCERIAFELRTNKELILSVLNDFELFKIEGEMFTSVSILERLKLREERSDKARKSAEAKWKSYHANAKRTQSERYAIKGNKKKVNKSKENENDFEGENPPQENTPKQTMENFLKTVSENGDDFKLFVAKISEKKGFSVDFVRNEILKFVNHWTEKKLNGTKQKWELQETFEVQKRLAYWFSNAPKYSMNYRQKTSGTRIIS